jgi:flagellar hook-associated protein 1 FlgK
MAGLSSILTTARDALSAQSFALSVTGQNITNASTPQYVRRDPLLETRALGNQTTGSVAVVGIRQAADAYLDRAYFLANSNHSAASQYDSELQSIEELFNDLSNTGLSTSLDAIFKSFEQLSARPNDKTVRTELLDRMDVFAARVREVGNTLAARKTDILDRARGLATQINERSTEIADLNRQITSEKQAGRDAADLVDRRNTKILALSELIDVQTIATENGGVMIRSSGTTLIEGGFSRNISVSLDANDGLMILASRADGSDPATNVTSFLSGGKLWALKEARDGTLTDVANRLDEFAFDVANALNQQHRIGFGLDGSTGKNLFDITPTEDGAAQAIRVSTDVLGQPDSIAASDTATNIPGGSSNAVLIAQLANSPSIAGGSTPSQAYANIVGNIGVVRAAATADVQLRQDIFTQAQSARESVSGVNLDEEMVNLTKYQRAYEAASKVITTVDELMQRLINTVGT